MKHTIIVLAVATLVFAGPYAFGQPAGWGNIKGRVVWGGKTIPEQKPIEAVNQNADKQQCLKNGPVLSEERVVNPKNKGLRYTLVWLINEDPKDTASLPIHPDLQEIKNKTVEIDQPACAFIPHVVAMREGQTLLVKNSSALTHNIKWSGKKEGNVNIVPGGKYEIKGLPAQRLPIGIECSYHTWMNGKVGIYAHPYFAVTDADGNFEIKKAPAGKYRIMVYNNAYLGGPKGRNGQEITIPADGTLNMGMVVFPPPPAPKD